MIRADGKRVEDLLRSVLVDNRLAAIEMIAPDIWDFQFAGAHLNVSVPWRILDGESIRFGSCDHNHKFGLPEPVDGVAVTMKWLAQKRVENISFDSQSADLQVAFAGAFFLDIFNHSAGWEGWNLAADNGINVIAMGGGDIAIWGN